MVWILYMHLRISFLGTWLIFHTWDCGMNSSFIIPDIFQKSDESQNYSARYLLYFVNCCKECVARMTCLYKNNGAVSCVGGNIWFIWSLCLPIGSLLKVRCTARCTQYFDTKLHGILPWADINRNCNTFLDWKQIHAYRPTRYVDRITLDVACIWKKMQWHWDPDHLDFKLCF